MTSTILSISRCDDRWCVAADGKTLATTRSEATAMATAVEAVEILRKSGITAEVGAVPAPEEPKSFAPDE